MGKRITPQRRGKGSSTYRSPSHRHLAQPGYPKSQETEGEVVELHHAPGRSAPLAEVEFENEETSFMIANHGLWVGENIEVGPDAEVEKGNVLPLRRVPVGMFVYNIELEPLDGGKLVKTAGSHATVISQERRKTVLELPSDKIKEVDNRCRATIGIVAGGGQTEQPFVKAGKKAKSLRSRAKRARDVRGVAMDAVDHPHGGGDHQHVGVPSTVSSNAPPGRKVGNLSSKKKKEDKKKKKEKER
ncbi:MAG: 50S ribosomal protein L2 [Candidatus Thermoplasmatota archaeon]